MDDRTQDVIKRLYCIKCNQETSQELVKRINASGAEFYGYWCLVCKWWSNGGTWIPKETLRQKGYDLENIRVAVMDSGQRCRHCGTRGSEEHHWAPKALFGQDEAEKWPKDYLCVPCHLLWHKTINENVLIADKTYKQS